MSSSLGATALVVLAALAASCSAQEASAPAGQAGPQAQPGATLLGTVGTAEDPEAYEIALTTQDGQAVEVVAAGTYTVVVEDFAQSHNFHLSGAGVEAATDVSGTGKKTFDVTFEAGAYQYLCDPHPSMSGALRVL